MGKHIDSFKRDFWMYHYIVRYKVTHDGNSPSIREIMDGIGYGSTAAVNFRLRSLEGLGLIRLGGVRSIEIVGGYLSAYAKVCEASSSIRISGDDDYKSLVVSLSDWASCAEALEE